MICSPKAPKRALLPILHLTGYQCLCRLTHHDSNIVLDADLRAMGASKRLRTLR